MFIDSKLHSFLKTLSIYEWNHFLKFVASPIFNKNTEIIELCSLLSDLYKKDKVSAVSKQDVWKKIYKSKVFNDLKYRRLLSDTLQLLQDYFSFVQHQKYPIQKKIHLLTALNERGLTAFFELEYAQADKIKQRQCELESHDYWLRYLLSLQKAQFQETTANRVSDKNIRETVSALDDYYLIMKLRFHAAQLHYKQISGVTDDDMLMKDILNFVSKNGLSHNPIAQIYYHIILSFEEKASQIHFEKVKSLLVTNGKLIAADVKKDLYAFTLNYCIRQINAGMIAFQAEIFNLYKKMLEQDLLINHGELSPFDFKNIITIALRLKEFKWTEKFIKNYQYLLPKEHQTNAMSFNTARLLFSKKQFGDVLPLLQDVNYTDVFYLLDSKTTLFKTYYELGEYEAMLSLSESFRILLNRKKIISSQHKTNYTNFLQIAMKLYRVDARNKSKIKSIGDLIKNTKGMADKVWLLEKYSELGGE